MTSESDLLFSHCVSHMSGCLDFVSILWLAGTTRSQDYPKHLLRLFLASKVIFIF